MAILEDIKNAIIEMDPDLAVELVGKAMNEGAPVLDIVNGALIPGISVVPYDKRETNNYQYVVFEVDEAEAGLSRDELQAVLHTENVLSRRYFYPGCHRMEPYRSHFPHAHLLLPQTERLIGRVLQVPTGTNVLEDDVRAIGGIVRRAVLAAPEVRRALTQTPAEPRRKAA